MLEVRHGNNSYLVYDIEADEPVVIFATRKEAEELIASLQIQELHAKLRRWSADAVPGVY